MVLSLVPIWSAKYFPSQNGPAYLLIIKMFKEFHNPEFNYSEYYELHPSIIPYMSFNLIVYLFHFVFPLLIAEKIGLSIYAILLPLSVFYFLKIANPGKTVLGFISFLYIYNFFLFRGYFNFCLAIPIFFFCFGYWLKHRDNLTFANIVILNILTLLLYLSHLYVFLLLFLALVIYVLLEDTSFKKVFGLIKFCLPCVILIINYLYFTSQNAAWTNYEFSYYIEGIPYNPIDITVYVIKQTLKWLYCFSLTEFFMSLIPLLFVLYLAIKRILKYHKHGVKFNWNLLFKDKWLILLIILCIFHLAIPWYAFGWDKIGIRVAPFAFILILACAERFSKEATKRAFVVVVFLASTSVYAIMTKHVIEINYTINEFTSGISKVDKNKALLPVLLEDTEFGNYLRPTVRAVNYYNIVKDGVNPYSAAIWNTLVPVWYKHYPVDEFLPQVNKNSIKSSIQRVKNAYDYVLLWGKDSAVDNLLQEHNFRLIHNKGMLRIYSNYLAMD